LSELGFVGHVAPHPLSPVWQATPVSKGSQVPIDSDRS
jgi:hypothetical protein